MKPYGYVRADGEGIFIYGAHQFEPTQNVELVPVYLAREWVGLTDAELLAWRPRFKFSRKLLAEVEAILKEKNQ